MYKILLVEDEVLLVDNLKKNLMQKNYFVDIALDGEEALYLLAEFEYDLIILDLGLPKRSGLSVLEHIRSEQNATPVLILTARNSWQERVEGLKKGADDYLGKPFHFEELMARIEVLLKRNLHAVDNLLTYGIAQLNLNSRSLKVGDKNFQLTKNEFILTKLFLSNPTKIFSKESLIHRLGDQDHERDLNLIEVYIHKLRQYLGKTAIETLRGQGYRLSETALEEADH
ncbi:MAG: DNA-binding response regulator [Piscirickettsiaceae bacterium CG_4_9_14_3_um_filter_43_564]|nr:response regulator transcription factor [Thiomicrospira sp.]OIP94500.1 MAG: DNA-binding response regulator [Thiomicrospira sp. CG2_30_44_34]PIQ02489.1 MAG: DNA-binding response regulator [Piscirickettsiaceae bacterium CG18_big_fil_WC_8_21_14_2_50_44_103]PIU37627.1 MAG: DNA-binding response regulator [Piscirickettsiaceae bacterium CG07_land_8_20_14_0_80_44_28]PIW57517.1 MAG: DNA-binding response regulator [Piscirickettsiaceae bacterium CG12_big_fil_rev_8_21_14_0_65_44_934]PIW76696.1 MAG: DNA